MMPANGVLDKNAVGIVKEACGFSNNARGFFRLLADEAIAFKFE
jgi:uncharacterized protein (DUF2141 family)